MYKRQEAGGVGSGLPDAVEEGVGGLEGAGVGDGVVDVVDADGLEAEVGGAVDEADFGIAEGGLGACLLYTSRCV